MANSSSSERAARSTLAFNTRTDPLGGSEHGGNATRTPRRRRRGEPTETEKHRARLTEQKQKMTRCMSPAPSCLMDLVDPNYRSPEKATTSYYSEDDDLEQLKRLQRKSEARAKKKAARRTSLATTTTTSSWMTPTVELGLAKSEQEGLGDSDREERDERLQRKSADRVKKNRRMSLSTTILSSSSESPARKSRSRLRKKSERRPSTDSAVSAEPSEVSKSSETVTQKEEGSSSKPEEKKKRRSSSKRSSSRSKQRPTPESPTSVITTIEPFDAETQSPSVLENDKEEQQQQLLTTTTGKRSVRFAPSETDPKEVLCTVSLIPRQSKSYNDFLWWSEPEIEARCRMDIEIATLVEKTYGPVLSRAYQAASAQDEDVGVQDATLFNPADVSLIMNECASARGLENDVYPEITHHHQEKHRKAVLDAQDVLREEKEDAAVSTLQSVLRQQSLKHSRPSQFVAHKLAELDQAHANQEHGIP